MRAPRTRTRRPGQCSGTAALAAGHRAAAHRATARVAAGLARRTQDVDALHLQIRAARDTPPRTAVVLDQLEDLRRHLREHHDTATLALGALRAARRWSAAPPLPRETISAALLSSALSAAIHCLGPSTRSIPGDEDVLDNAQAALSMARRFIDIATHAARDITVPTTPATAVAPVVRTR